MVRWLPRQALSPIHWLPRQSLSLLGSAHVQAVVIEALEARSPSQRRPRLARVQSLSSVAGSLCECRHPLSCEPLRPEVQPARTRLSTMLSITPRQKAIFVLQIRSWAAFLVFASLKKLVRPRSKEHGRVGLELRKLAFPADEFKQGRERARKSVREGRREGRSEGGNERGKKRGLRWYGRVSPSFQR
eukprot:2992383-Rhodomonas_salina.1